MSILEQIFNDKRLEVAKARERLSLKQLESLVENISPPPDFVQALIDSSRPTPRLIAEVKHKSPSKGVFLKEFAPLSLAKIYQENGASAISVLTDEKYFGGSLRVLQDIHDLDLGLPLLRKDFIFDEYQLFEACLAGASAVLLIVAMLDQKTLTGLIKKAETLGLTPLVEIHNQNELDQAIAVGAKVIGINNRNLHDFSVSLNTSLKLAQQCPPEITLVSESGIKDQEDIQLLSKGNIDAILVGEALVTANEIALQTQQFSNGGL